MPLQNPAAAGNGSAIPRRGRRRHGRTRVGHAPPTYATSSRSPEAGTQRQRGPRPPVKLTEQDQPATPAPTTNRGTVRAHSIGLAAVHAATLTAVAVGLIGCGSQSSDTNKPTATAGSSGAQIEVGNTINYGSFGTTADIDCADGKSLNVGGSNNTLTVKGVCANVNIGGADNKITFERVDKGLSVVGLNNTITYRAGDPKINDTGSGNKVTKG